MSLNVGQKHIADRLGKLLAGSFLDEGVKKIIVENLDEIPSYLVFSLVDALENERESLKAIACEIEIFLRKQDRDWKKLEVSQRAMADKIVERALQEIEDDVKLKQTRENI